MTSEGRQRPRKVKVTCKKCKWRAEAPDKFGAARLLEDHRSLHHGDSEFVQRQYAR